MITPNFKEPRVSTAARRRRKGARLKRAENANKAEVRVRDVVCRFPLCACRLFNLFLEVSHQEHKGMGGDPSGERSKPWIMVLVCNWRHKESKLSIDKKGLRVVALTPAGTDGPIAWEIDLGKFSHGTFANGTWVELARELEPGVLAPIAEPARNILESLAAEIKTRFR